MVTCNNQEVTDTGRRNTMCLKSYHSDLQGEIINLYVGQAGCQLGNICWEMYCLEHNIRPDGVLATDATDAPPKNFFKCTGSGKVVPRASFIDLEPTVIDELRTGRFRSFFSPAMMISGKEDAANCFARGYITLATDMIDLILQRVREMAGECDKLQGFIISRAYGGGTGSGLVARLLESLSQEYPKRDIFEFSIYPAPKLSSIIVEPYNTSLATHTSLEYTSGTFIVDNEACYDICDRLLDICSPSFLHINRLLGQVISSVTASLRFEGSVNVDFNELKTNLFPFPRIRFPIISYAPLVSGKQVAYENITESALVNWCFEPGNQLVKCDQRKGKYMACTILFRGDVSASSINAAIASIKAKKSVRFVDWCTTGFKVGINDVPPVCVPGGDLVAMTRTCLMLANSTAIKSAWAKVNRKFDLMFSRKAFLHWYLAEGLEEGDFQDTRLDLAALECDYTEIESDK